MVATTTAPETLSIPLGGAGQASIRLGFGGGEMRLGRAEPGILLSGTFEGGVEHRLTGDGGHFLEPASMARSLMSGCRLQWDVKLAGDVPIDLQLDTGGNRSVIDLEPLTIRRLTIKTGASETNVRLPAAGHTSVRVECGFASVNLAVPQGVAARITGSMGLGAIKVDEGRFPRQPDGWVSPAYDTAADRVDIDITGGFGSVSVG